MSRIFEALRRVERSAVQPGPDAGPDAGPAQPERRRSARWSAHVPVYVYGHLPGQPPFHEEAYSTNVSAIGARLVMMATVRPGQTLLLTNKVTQVEKQCRVAYAAGHDPQTLEVAVEFPDLVPDFWRLTRDPNATACAARPSHARRRRARQPKTGE